MPSPRAVLATALVVAACGFVYELLAGTVASWVLGDAVTQFSTVIGAYLSALGLGAYLSRYVTRELARAFVLVELGVALVGGAAPAGLLLLVAHPTSFRVALYAAVAACGTLVGLEVPILTRILQPRADFRSLVARVLAYDHAGSFLGSVAYALVLVPRLGPLRAAPLVGMANVAVAGWSTWLLRAQLAPPAWRLRAASVGVFVVLAVVFARASGTAAALEAGG